MNRSPLIIYTIFLHFTYSCKYVNLYKDTESLKELNNLAGCSDLRLYYTKDKSINPDKEFVEIELDDCSLLKQGLNEKFASSCISYQLYIKLQEETLNNYSGISVVFDKNSLPRQQYFYSMEDLSLVKNSFANIVQLINCNSFDKECIMEVFDTTFQSIKTKDLDKALSVINSKYPYKSSKKTGIIPMFEQIDIMDKKTNKLITCIDALLLFRQLDSTYIPIYFETIKCNKKGNIINISFTEEQ